LRPTRHPSAHRRRQQLPAKRRTSGGFQYYVSASGDRGNSTGFYLDGAVNEDALTEIANIFPNPDAIQEFSFETNNYSAKFGGRGGGVMNAVTRVAATSFMARRSSSCEPAISTRAISSRPGRMA